jgi:hypothetical protein
MSTTTTRSNRARSGVFGVTQGAIAAALVVAILAAVAVSLPAPDPHPLVAREVVAAQLTQTRAEFDAVFERARTRRRLTNLAETDALERLSATKADALDRLSATEADELDQSSAAEADALDRLTPVPDSAAWHRKVALEEALERLTAIPDTVEWHRGVARSDGVDLDGTEPAAVDVADVDRVQSAYEIWERLHLWPAVRADPVSRKRRQRDRAAATRVRVARALGGAIADDDRRRRRRRRRHLGNRLSSRPRGGCGSLLVPRDRVLRRFLRVCTRLFTRTGIRTGLRDRASAAAACFLGARARPTK